MSGIKYLLDTNFVLGMLKSSPDVLEVLASKQLTSQHCAFSVITGDVEDAAIRIRRTRRAKLPDALIAATALCHSLELLTLDTGLQATFEAVRPPI